MARELELRVPAVVEALIVSAGIVAHAAQKLRVTPQTVRRYIREFPECREAMHEAREMNCDLAETKLLQNIKAGKEASIFFYLKTIGKQRGYIEGREHSGPNGGPIVFEKQTIDVSKLTFAEMTAILAAMEPNDEDEQG